MKTINLTRNQVAIVDDKTFDMLSAHKWSYANNGYAVSRIDGKVICMHRFLVDCPEGMYVDHINRQKLDNRLCNLRIVTPTQSLMNQSKRKNSKSIFRGVRLSQNRWSSSIVVDGQEIKLGRFLTQREAAVAYNEAAIHHFGEYAALNDLSAISPDDDKPLLQRHTQSSYVGVYPDNRSHKWIAQIMVNRIKTYIGQFDTDEQAAHAYDSFVKEHNLNRKINFPD